MSVGPGKGQGDIGVSIDLNEQELINGQARVAQSLNDLAKTVEQVGDRIDKAMQKAASSTQRKTKATKDAAAAEHEHGKAAEQAGAKSKRASEQAGKAAEQAGRQAGNAHTQGGKAAHGHRNSVMELQMAYMQVTAVVGVLAAAIGYVGNESKEAYAKQDQAFKGLQSITQRMAESFAEAKEEAQGFADDGLMNIAESSKAIQNYLATKFTLDEAKEILQISKDAAAFNRQAGFSIGEAVVRMSEGVRLGMSQVSDAAGITKNLSMILKEQGKSEQDVMNIQSDASVRQALLNGLRQEGALFAGNAAKAADTLAGAESRAANEAFKAKAAFGETLAPAIQVALSAVSALLGKLGEFSAENPQLARTIFLVVGGATALTAAVGGLAVAFLALNASLGPVGWTLMGITAAAGAIAGLVVAEKAAADESRRLSDETGQLMREYEALRTALDGNTLSTDEKERASKRLKDTLDKLFELQPHMAGWFDAEGRLLDAATEKWDRYRDAVIKAKKVELGQSVATASADLAKLEKERSEREAQIKGDTDPVVESYLTQAKMRKETPEQIEARRRELTGRVDDRVFMELNELDRQIAILKAQLERDKAHLDALNEPIDPEDVIPPPPPSSGTGGGTPPDPFKESLRYIDHLRNTESISAQEEIDMLETVAQRHAKTQEQKWQIEERVFKIRKQMTDTEHREGEAAERDAEQARKRRLELDLRVTDHLVRMGTISKEQELANLRSVLEQHELTTEERMGLIERIRQAEQGIAQETARTEDERTRATIDRINHEQRMGRLSRDQELAALEEHLTTEQAYYDRHADQRWSIEERIYALKDGARQDDLRREQEAQRTAAQNQQSWLQLIIQADLDSIRAGHQADQRRQQDRIKGIQDQLAELERMWAAEDARNQKADLQAELASVMADTRYQKVNADGEVVWTYDEARVRELEQQLADIERDEQRDAQRQLLQDQIQAEQEKLTAMRDHHQGVEAERQKFWSGLQTLDLASMEELRKAAEIGLDNWAKVFRTKLPELQTDVETMTENIRKAMEIITGPAGGAGQEMKVPNLPPSLANSTQNNTTSVSIGSIALPGVTNAQQFAAALPAAIVSATTGSSLLTSLLQAGRIALRTGLR